MQRVGLDRHSVRLGRLAARPNCCVRAAKLLSHHGVTSLAAKSAARTGRAPFGRSLRSAMVRSPVPQQISRMAASGRASTGRNCAQSSATKAGPHLPKVHDSAGHSVVRSSRTFAARPAPHLLRRRTHRSGADCWHGFPHWRRRAAKFCAADSLYHAIAFIWLTFCSWPVLMRFLPRQKSIGLILPMAATSLSAAALTPNPPLMDSHGRVIHDLRVSITDRCNYKCVYCRTGEEARNIRNWGSVNTCASSGSL